jgi:hypothetical protein
MSGFDSVLFFINTNASVRSMLRSTSFTRLPCCLLSKTDKGRDSDVDKKQRIPRPCSRLRLRLHQGKQDRIAGKMSSKSLILDDGINLFFQVP